ARERRAGPLALTWIGLPNRARQLPQSRSQGRALPPDEREGSVGHRRSKRADTKTRPLRLGGRGELGQDRHPSAAGDHVDERREARGPELKLVRLSARTERERLVAEAVAVVEEKDAGVAELRRLRGRPLRPQRVIGSGGQDEGIVCEDLVLDVSDLRFQREQRGVEGPGIEAPDE